MAKVLSPYVDLDNSPLRVVTIDTSVDLRQAAIDFANKRLTDELNSKAGLFKRFARGVWKGSIAKDYYRAKYAREAEEEMLASDNFLSKDATPEQVANVKRALFERFSLEYDEAVHKEAGESKIVLGDDSEFAISSKDIIRRYVEDNDGSFGEESLKQELNRIIQESIDNGNSEIPGGDLIKISNLLDIAQSVKARVEHGQSIDNVLENMQFIAGEARGGVRTSLRETTVDRLFDKLSKSKNSRLRAVSPDALLIAAGVTGSLFGFGGRRLAATSLTLAPGVGGALIAGWRENKRTKEDRIQHMREMAQGGEIDGGSRRRQEMEAARYETKSAIDLTDSLNEISLELSSGDDIGNSLDLALRRLADINTRISIGDEDGVDLISFSDQEKIGDERLGLDIARAQLRIQIDQLLGDMTSEERSSTGLSSGTAAELIAGRSSEFVDVIKSDFSDKDRAFQKLKAKRVAKASAVGFGTALLFGVITQEVATTFNSNVYGLADRLWDSRGALVGSDGKIHLTMLASWIRGDENLTIPSAYNGNMINGFLPGSSGGKVLMPEGMSFRSDGSGVYSIVDGGGNKIVDNITIGSGGEINPTAITALQSKGFNISSSSRDILTPGNDVTRAFTFNNPGDYVQQNGGVEISGRSWADNGTRIPDMNELRGWEMGVRQDGTIDYSIHTMTEGGSFGQGLPVDWQKSASDGRLVALISGSRGSQNYAFELPIGTDGKIAIAPDHPAHRLFEVSPGSEWKAGTNFKGGFIEIAEKTANPDGTIKAHMLATDIGSDSTSSITINKTFPGEDIINQVTDYEIKPPGAGVVPVHTEMAPSIPVVGRRSLEELARERTPNPYLYGYEGGGPGSEEEVAKAVRERSPRLIDNPEAQLNTREELDWYRSELESRRGAVGLTDIEEKVSKSAELRDMAGSTEVIITVPVAAIQEADTIYGTLSLYGQQDRESLEKSIVLINLNWLDEAKSDPESAKKIEKARSEIERARLDYPHLNVAMIENEYSAEQSRVTGGVIGYAASDLMDAALISVHDSMRAGIMPDSHDVLIVRNDADPEGMSRNYIRQYRSSFNDPDSASIDVFKGATRFGVRWAKKYPGFTAASNFAASLSVLLSQRGLPATGGANFGIRASTLAAVGGLGRLERTGAGSDDGALGRRIRMARWGVGVLPPERSQNPADYRKIARHVRGAAVDTNPSRLIPYHLEGRAYTEAWRPDDFSGPDGTYRGRSAGRNVVPYGKSEIHNDWDTEFRAIEESISSELSWNGVDDGRRALAIFFGGVPGAYTVTGEGESVRFRLTNAGREYLKMRFSRESDGRRGTYGDRLMRSQYGVISPNGRRPVAVQSPMIRPAG